MTAEEKQSLVKANQRAYRLPKEYLFSLKLPKANKIKIYELDKVLDAGDSLTIPEKIQHLKCVLKNLERKMSILNRGGKIKGWNFVSAEKWQQFEAAKKQAKKNAVVRRQKIE